MVVLAGIFLAGRFGWRPAGFRACHAAGITSVEVGENESVVWNAQAE